MSYSPILLFHILGGTVGFLSGTAALSFPKGSRRHIQAGHVLQQDLVFDSDSPPAALAGFLAHPGALRKGLKEESSSYPAPELRVAP